MFVPVDFKVASSIRRKPWLIERQAALTYLDLLQQVLEGKATFEDIKTEPQNKLFVHSELVTAPTDIWAASKHPGYDGKSLAVLPITGPLMKDDFCGGFGTASLRNELNKMNATDSIQTIVLLIDSPGGTVDGTQVFGDAIKSSTKQVIAIVDEMACSAAYWLASCATKIIATSKTALIGSIGTMVSFYDRSQQLEENGIVLREYTADASKDKNKMMRMAMDGDGKVLIKELLNPMNDVFLATVKENRGKQLNQEETLSGKVFLAEQALEYGLIDEISSFDQTINNILQQSKTSITMKIGASFKGILAFLGITLAADKTEVELNQEQLGLIEAALPELEKTKAKVTELEAVAKTNLEVIAAATKERDEAKAEVVKLQAEVTRLTAENKKLGEADAGKITSVKSDGDKFNDQKQDPAEMSFQKELMSKIDG